MLLAMLPPPSHPSAGTALPSLAVLLLGGGLLLPQAAQAAPAGAGADLDASVAPLFRDDQPGAAVLVRKGDRILLRKAYGLADRNRKQQPLRPEMVFRLGSLTKQFTAVAIMMLVDAGKLSLDDNIAKLVPEYPTRGAPITVRQLLTHTSGSPSYTDQPSFGLHSRQDLTHQQLLDLIKDLPLEFPPGTRQKYSNSGYYLLGMIIEKVSGGSYADFIRNKIFAPLGMRASGYGDDKRLGTWARGHDRRALEVVDAQVISMKPPFAAGGLSSTADDLARWDAAITAGKLLRKESWAQVFARSKLADGTTVHYGFGFGLGELQGHQTQSHSGGIPGFATHLLRIPEQQLLVVILANSVPAAFPLEPLARQLAAAAMGKPLVAPRAVKLEPATLDRYLGVYQTPDGKKVMVRRGPKGLTFQRSGGPMLQAMPESPTRFFAHAPAFRFAFGFAAADDGRVRPSRIDVTRPDGNREQWKRTEEPLPNAPDVPAAGPTSPPTLEAAPAAAAPGN